VAARAEVERRRVEETIAAVERDDLPEAPCGPTNPS